MIFKLNILGKKVLNQIIIQSYNKLQNIIEIIYSKKNKLQNIIEIIYSKKILIYYNSLYTQDFKIITDFYFFYFVIFYIFSLFFFIVQLLLLWKSNILEIKTSF